MKLEQQVCSLDLAKRLKELGVKQESYAYWGITKQGTVVMGKDATGWLVLVDVEKERYIQEADQTYAAFTVAELGELLPPLLKIDSDFWYLVCEKFDENWTLSFQMRDYHKTNEVVWKFLEGATTLEKTEADARAIMLIHLLENKLITL